MTQRLLNSKTTAGTLIISIIILFISSCSPSGSTHKAKAEYTSTLVTRFPFTVLSGGIVILKSTIDNFPDSLNFILDTGSGGVSLDSATVEYLRLPKVPSERFIRGIGSLKKVSYVTNRTLHLPKLDVPHLDFHINDYELLTSVNGIKIDGIIGYSFLSRYIVKINYDNSMLEVWNPGTTRYPKKGIVLKPTINGIPVVNAAITDRRTSLSRFYFDTGAGLYFLMSEDFRRDSNILIPGKKIINTQAEGLSGKNAMQLTIVKELQLDRYKFKKVPTHIFEDVYNVTAYPYLGGLIGNDLLRRFNLIVNYGQKEIHMLPNSHFNDPFDYSYTGLGIYMIEGHVVIEDVLKDSPGEKAGLMPGDIIVAIDNNLSGSIQAYKNMLQVVGAKLNILISRDGKPMMRTIKVLSIM